MTQQRNIVREIGTALAVLAIYLLTLLAPLHEARASQLAFEHLGYSTIQSGWVFCSVDQPAGPDGDITVSKCPATGIGKSALVAPILASLSLDLRSAGLAAPLPAARFSITPAIIASPSGPRGPPALI